MIRRGESKVSNVPSENLITFIRKRALLGTDELSGDGKNWIRVDRHYQLQKYFPKLLVAVIGYHHNMNQKDTKTHTIHFHLNTKA